MPSSLQCKVIKINNHKFSTCCYNKCADNDEDDDIKISKQQVK